MNKIILSITIIFITVSFSQTNEDCPCCSDEHRQFHFWIGDWNVFDTSGTKLGTNTITISQNNCLIIENWESANSPFTGTSYNFYDNSDSTWNQTWVDNQGSNLKMIGKLTNGKMILRSELQENENVGEYYHQITWTPNEDSTVTQRWDVVNQDGIILNTAFFGIYKSTTAIMKIL